MKHFFLSSFLIDIRLRDVRLHFCMLFLVREKIVSMVEKLVVNFYGELCKVIRQN